MIIPSGYGTINIEETFKLISSAPPSWKELTDIIVTINGAVVSSKEPEVYLWIYFHAFS